MTTRDAINILWEYHHVHHIPEEADLIFVLGSNDPRVAEWAATLYKRGLADKILFSGGAGRFTGELAGTEAERFAQKAEQAGVPPEAILLETKSTNTGENIQFSREILEQHGLSPRKIIAVQKPYMERRTLATMEAQWPGMLFQVSSPPLSFNDYLTESLPEHLVVSAMVGDFQRILEYPKQGFSSIQPVTAQALEAFHLLVKEGYDSQLLPNVPLP